MKTSTQACPQTPKQKPTCLSKLKTWAHFNAHETNPSKGLLEKLNLCLAWLLKSILPTARRLHFHPVLGFGVRVLKKEFGKHRVDFA